MNDAPQPPSPSGPDIPPDWNRLPVEHLPTATFWPAGLALGITFLFWGLISSWVVFVVGLGLFVVALAGWVTDLRHERKQHR